MYADYPIPYRVGGRGKLEDIFHDTAGINLFNAFVFSQCQEWLQSLLGNRLRLLYSLDMAGEDQPLIRVASSILEDLMALEVPWILKKLLRDVVLLYKQQSRRAELSQVQKNGAAFWRESRLFAELVTHTLFLADMLRGPVRWVVQMLSVALKYPYRWSSERIWSTLIRVSSFYHLTTGGLQSATTIQGIIDLLSSFFSNSPKAISGTAVSTFEKKFAPRLSEFFLAQMVSSPPTFLLPSPRLCL